MSSADPADVSTAARDDVVPAAAADRDADVADDVARPTVLARARALWCQLVSGLG